MNLFEQIRKTLCDLWTVAIVCYQWGDTGKGKIVDLLAEWADIIVRGTGADNAGHTLVVKFNKYIMHLVPCGILYDKEGKINVIGSGVAINPRTLIEELEILEHEDLSYNNLMIALNAKLILPQHILLDRLKESGKGKLGTTGRGVGPVFTDHYARIGLIINDVLNPEVFRKKFERNLSAHLMLLKTFDPELVKTIMQHPHLQSGDFYDAETVINVEEVVCRYCEYGRRLREMIKDTDRFIRASVGKKHILLEGAQGLFLSVDKGNYPYVTSSDCSDQGLAKGAGLRDSDLDLVLGIVKAFYMTRVGNGPFPTELGGQESANWCGLDIKEVGRLAEKQKYPGATVNSSIPFTQGVGFRQAGDEYGATTSRPRRCGWLDLPMLRYAIKECGPHVVLTKLDVLSKCKIIKLCVEYVYVGPIFNYGEITLTAGDHLQTAIPFAEVMEHCRPVYQEFPGWLCDISQIKEVEDLPEKFDAIMRFIIRETGAIPEILSIGADREATIIL